MRMSFLSNNIKPILGLLIIVLAFTYYFVNLFNHTKPNEQVLIAIVGLCGQVVGYFFHTTKASPEKEKQ